jgi:hypothetical protein
MIQMESLTMESTAQNSILAHYTSLLGKFRVPGFDLDAVIESRRKDVDALATLTTTALAGIQSLGEKQADIARTTMSQLQTLVTKPDASPVGASASVGDMVRQALVGTVSNMQEFTGTAWKIPSASFAVVSSRVAENVEEFKAMLQPKQ